MMDNSYPMRHRVLPVFGRPAGARPARGGRVLACLACAVLTVSAGCRSTRGAGASSPPLDGEVSVCGLATVDQIQQTVGRQIEEFAINNNSRTPNNLFFMCVINVSDDDGTGVFELEVSTTSTDSVRSVPAGSTFEEVAAAPKAEPVTLDSVPGQGAVIPDDHSHAILVWSYPDTDIVATLKRTHLDAMTGPRLFQDAADLENLFTLIGPAAPRAADGPTQRWSMYPTGDHNPTPTP